MSIHFKPGHFVLTKTFEKVILPANIAAFVEGRSTWGRVGVTVHVTAPKIDLSLTCAVNFFDRTAPPNLRFTDEKTLSTFERRW